MDNGVDSEMLKLYLEARGLSYLRSDIAARTDAYLTLRADHEQCRIIEFLRSKGDKPAQGKPSPKPEVPRRIKYSKIISCVVMLPNVGTFSPH